MADNLVEGDIEIQVDSPTNKRAMSLQLSNVYIRDWFQKRRDGVRPWSEFISVPRFQVPKSIAPVSQRIVRNIEKFQSNYMFVFVGVVIICILTSPLLLIAIAASLGACYIAKIRNDQQKLTVLGRELTLPQQYAAIGVASIPILWIVGAGSAVFWVIGASFFVIMLHASLYKPDEEMEPFADAMEQV